MVTVRLIRVGHEGEDERTPFLVKLSRVPCVGESVSTVGYQGDDKRVGFYVVHWVGHDADPKGKSPVVARVKVELDPRA